MAIYEPDLSYTDMQKALDSFKCARCGTYLTLAWSAQKNSYMLRCGQVLEHEGIVPYGRDPEIIEINAKLRGGTYPMTTEQAKQETMTKMLARVDQARFPQDLTIDQKRLIAAVSIEYGLDPVFNELMLYQGNPYVTINARRRKAQETDKLDGINARPATQEERKARRVPHADYLFVAEVWVKGASHPFAGWGRVFEAETRGDIHLPIVKDPAAMAEKRAESQALRRAFHLPLPSFEEIIQIEYVLVPETTAVPKPKTPAPKARVGVDTTTAPKPITQPQRQKIWSDATKMGYKDHEVHAIIKAKFNVESINDLSITQASALIDMIARGEEIPAPQAENLGPERPLHENPDDSN